MYNPDKWVLIRVDNTYFKVLGSWSGSYLYGSSWRLNSGIDKIIIEGDYFIFQGHSGSHYKCHKKSYGLNIAGADAWAMIKERYKDRVELLEEKDAISSIRSYYDDRH